MYVQKPGANVLGSVKKLAVFVKIVEQMKFVAKAKKFVKLRKNIQNFAFH
jgi:hypothetical protein